MPCHILIGLATIDQPSSAVNVGSSIMTARSNPTYTDLRDTIAFPSFASCPDENDVPDIYYHMREDGVYAPSRHWCFLGEITDTLTMIRLRLWVRDKDGMTMIPIAFHLDHRDRPAFRVIHPNQLHAKPDHPNLPEHLISSGNTIAVLYAQQHNFVDMTTGLRIEDADHVQIFPCGLEELLSLNDQILHGGIQSDSVRTCRKCGTAAASLQRCSGCHLVCYCGKDCQIADWSDDGHKKDCKLAKQVALLMKQDWQRFTGYYSFPLSKSISQGR